jgi:hypothetical protein
MRGRSRPFSATLLFTTTLLALLTPAISLSQTVAPANNGLGAKTRTASANLLGRIVDVAGRPQANVEILVKDLNGNTLRSLRTNQIGRYCVTDLTTGPYALTQDPARAAFDGQTVVTVLPPEGLYVDWRVTANSAIAIATPPREFSGCRQFLAGDTLLERIFGVVSGDMLANGSIAAGLGVAAGAAAGAGKNLSVASPSQ